MMALTYFAPSRKPEHRDLSRDKITDYRGFQLAVVGFYLCRVVKDGVIVSERVTKRNCKKWVDAVHQQGKAGLDAKTLAFDYTIILER